MTTGEKIKQLRTQKGLSQEELGSLVGVKKAAINKYEKGNVINLKRSTIARLALILETSATYLLGFDEEYPQTAKAHYDHSELDKKILEKLSKLTSENLEIALAQIDVLLLFQQNNNE